MSKSCCMKYLDEKCVPGVSRKSETQRPVQGRIILKWFLKRYGGGFGMDSIVSKWDSANSFFFFNTLTRLKVS